jgi:hypothetical protein
LEKISSIKNILTAFAVFIFLFFFNCSAQVKNNLQLFNALVDSSITMAVSFIPDSVKTIKLESEGGPFEIFNSEVINSLSMRGYHLVNGNNSFGIQYVVKDAVTSYGDIFRNGLLGDYYVPRSLHLSGSINYSGSTIFSREFEYSSLDTVKTENIELLENSAYAFTRGKLPAEPFFSSILEPVVVIGTAALAVILFFTIRSK